MVKNLNIIKKMATICIITEKNKSSLCFQSLRKEDLYKKGKKGIDKNFIFFIGSLVFSNSRKIKIHNTLQYYNLNLVIDFNKSATNIAIMKIVEYQNNKTKWQ